MKECTPTRDRSLLWAPSHTMAATSSFPARTFLQKVHQHPAFSHFIDIASCLRNIIIEIKPSENEPQNYKTGKPVLVTNINSEPFPDVSLRETEALICVRVIEPLPIAALAMVPSSDGCFKSKLMVAGVLHAFAIERIVEGLAFPSRTRSMNIPARERSYNHCTTVVVSAH